MHVPVSVRVRHRTRPLLWLALVVLLPTDLAAQGRQAAPAARLQVIEAEALVGSVRGMRGVGAQRMEDFGNGWSSGAQLLWSGAAPGAVLDISFDVDQPAVYAAELYFTRAPDYAQIGFAIDHQESRTILDTYGPRVAPPTPYQAGSFPLAAGTHTLSLKVNGKHAQSGGYLVGLDQIRLYPTAALAVTERQDAPGATRAAPVLAADTRSPAPAVRAAAPLAGATGAARATGSEQGGDCPSACMGSVSTVYRKNAEGQCLAWFRVPCDPYECDAKSGMCRYSCASDEQCGQGSKCDTNTGMCTSAPAACVDAVTVRSANGQTHSCLPYKCRAGVCRESCESSNDCKNGYSCNVYGRCAKKP